MRHFATNSSGHENDRFHNTCAGSRRTINNTADRNHFMCQGSEDYSVESFTPGHISHDMDQQFRQRWKIE